MSSRVWPRPPRSGVNKTRDVVDIDNSISGARGVENNDKNNDDNNTTSSMTAEGWGSPSVND